MNHILDYSVRVQVWTYGVADGLESNSSYGKIFLVPEDWLEKVVKQFGYEDISDFQSAYIWDESKDILSIAERDGVVFEEHDLSLYENSKFEDFENFGM
ncbi:hypothetical protein P8917_10040 [Bacillus atrophaeus]|uniref:hypothetical protein n=1 Tax=Bacillus atrophaeus TaxID=1452 RepID=UPI00227EF9EB|nr:hypothetical protein [Bacillus atrophaeus]MCY8497783.1 hypothetical protein [Bacillus atrophaeus]MCY8814912.1 hypothetical protein [Bacillus atrophaeus]MCY8821542.1 hypothetical protein [Bacillus atrophaeus]MCY8830972.1 hypothetical protein [Bacillus atrophaeus]MCY8835231.1 hypothetical protein [Bacillus atrophaeus]